MKLSQAFDLGRKAGRAEKTAEGTRYEIELLNLTEKARDGVVSMEKATDALDKQLLDLSRRAVEVLSQGVVKNGV